MGSMKNVQVENVVTLIASSIRTYQNSRICKSSLNLHSVNNELDSKLNKRSYCMSGSYTYKELSRKKKKS